MHLFVAAVLCAAGVAGRVEHGVGRPEAHGLVGVRALAAGVARLLQFDRRPAEFDLSHSRPA